MQDHDFAPSNWMIAVPSQVLMAFFSAGAGQRA
jgi:hypothetical protein